MVNRKLIAAHLAKAHLGEVNAVSAAVLARLSDAQLLALHASAAPLRPHDHPAGTALAPEATPAPAAPEPTPAAPRGRQRPPRSQTRPAPAAAAPRTARPRATRPVCVHPLRVMNRCRNCPLRRA